MSEVPLYSKAKCYPPRRFQRRLQVVRVMTQEGYGWSNESHEMARWYVISAEVLIDSGLVGSIAGPFWEGCREGRRCSRDTYPESYTTECTSIRRRLVIHLLESIN